MQDETSNYNTNSDFNDFLVMQDICQQIENIHSEWSRMNLTDIEHK